MVIDETTEARFIEVLEDYTNTADSIEITNDLIEVLVNTPDNFDKVLEFHNVFEQETNYEPISNDKKYDHTRKLRLSLMLEELIEYADACNLRDWFKIQMQEEANQSREDFPVNEVERLDALTDLRYVLYGTFLAEGLADVADEAFNEVHRSNMSKLCLNEEEAKQTVANYETRGTNAQYVSVANSNMKRVLRINDFKALKSINYSPANLSEILDKFSKELDNDLDSSQG